MYQLIKLNDLNLNIIKEKSFDMNLSIFDNYNKIVILPGNNKIEANSMQDIKDYFEKNPMLKNLKYLATTSVDSSKNTLYLNLIPIPETA